MVDSPLEEAIIARMAGLFAGVRVDAEVGAVVSDVAVVGIHLSKHVAELLADTVLQMTLSPGTAATGLEIFFVIDLDVFLRGHLLSSGV